MYERAIEAIPDSVLLHLAYAELEESRGQSDHGVEVLKTFVENEPTTLGKLCVLSFVFGGLSSNDLVVCTCVHGYTGHIIYQHYVRRTQGKEAARKVFSSTKDLRKKGVLTYHVSTEIREGAVMTMD